MCKACEIPEEEVEKYAVYSPGCCEEHGGPELCYYDTLREAEEIAISGETIFKIVKEIK